MINVVRDALNKTELATHCKLQTRGTGDTIRRIESLIISGWDKVDLLARAVIDMKGISVSEEEAKNVVKLYDDLVDFDKKPLSYKSIIRKPPKGRFCSRKRERHIGVVQMKRCFFAGKKN